MASDASERPRTLSHSLITVAIGALLTVLLGAVLTWWFRQLDERAAHPGSATITTPQDGETVGRVVLLSGGVERPDSYTDRQLWVVRVDVNNVQAYYPQGRAFVDGDT